MSINPDGTPGPVAPGEIIDSEWGNAVAESIQNLQAVAPVGSIWMWMAGAIPTKCLPLQGGNADRTVYADLFALWGVQFGAGDGTTTFGLPDMRARFPVCMSPGDALFATPNNKGGGRDAIIPQHLHGLGAHGSHSVDVTPAALPHYVPKWNQGPGYPGTPGNYIAIPDNNVPGNGDYDGSTFGASAGTAHTHLFSIQAGMSLTGGSDGVHDHGVGVGAAGGTTDNQGEAAANGRIPPFIVINFIVKAQKG